MGLLCASVLAVFVVSLVFIGNRALQNYQPESPPDDTPMASVELSSSTSNATNTNTTTNISSQRRQAAILQGVTSNRMVTGHKLN
ncbi:hypothetical protein THAR02_05190 [Trichoderma harzianum]|uniref:Uncharacterized protein n=1 Tax=Trichoderma harzianum TaxID=5544 RepID=A0A0F9XR38_TRIHA|nr:hypothetical protein THAR02_05190 [Trichoderma harzianum]